MLAIDFCNATLEPWPISIMAITVPTPMITPKAVKADRILLRRSAFKAVRKVRGKKDARIDRRGCKTAPAIGVSAAADGDGSGTSSASRTAVASGASPLL